MPCVEAKLSFKTNSIEKETIAKNFCDIIGSIPGKDAQHIMVEIHDEFPLFFGGTPLDKSAFISVKLLGTIPDVILNETTHKFCMFLENNFKVPGKCVYVQYEKIVACGSNGQNAPQKP